MFSALDIQISDDFWLNGQFCMHHRLSCGVLEKIKFSHTTIDDVLEVADSYSFSPFICLKQTPMLFFPENELGVYNCNL